MFVLKEEISSVVSGMKKSKKAYDSLDKMGL